MSRFAAGRVALRMRNSARVRPHVPLRTETPQAAAKPGVWVKLLQALEDGLANGGDPFYEIPEKKPQNYPVWYLKLRTMVTSAASSVDAVWSRSCLGPMFKEDDDEDVSVQRRGGKGLTGIGKTGSRAFS